MRFTALCLLLIPLLVSCGDDEENEEESASHCDNFCEVYLECLAAEGEEGSQDWDSCHEMCDPMTYLDQKAYDICYTAYHADGCADGDQLVQCLEEEGHPY